VKGKVKKSTESGQQAQLHYAVGSVNGPIKFADVEFAGYTLKRQSFSKTFRPPDLIDVNVILCLQSRFSLAARPLNKLASSD
jgi:hypothetical protein